ncbi:MAG TPA: T9SS type A sorting domain-containing protein [Bacteroidia bacterium]|nr:T9SS type A sorting domain-containing protein [Bacteroidia bacterium]
MKQRSTKAITKMFAVVVGMFAAAGAVNAQSVINVQDSIYTNTHWTACNQYLLHGYVYVTAGTTLTIDPGTIIKGDKNTKGTLIIERGAMINAQGTATQPIIFTSNQPAGQRTYGDWGGVILVGRAPNNWLSGQNQVEGGPRSLYGGNNIHDNSGVMSYVRIEFPGVAFSPNNEVNGLSIYSVGDATQIDHIQVSYSGDDSYEWFGGTVNAKYLVSYRPWDDSFDQDCGWRGHVQFAFDIRDPYAADVSGSHAMEMDSYQSGTKSGLAGDTSGLTMPVWSNVTLVGPMVSPTTTSYDPQYVSGIHSRRGNATSVLNSVIIGYPCGILFDESSASYGSTTRNLRILGSAGDSIMQYRGDVVCGIPANGSPVKKELEYVIDGARSLTPTNTEGDTTTGAPFGTWSGPYNFYLTPAYKNKIYPTEQTGISLHSPFNLASPDPTPTSVSPICYNSTSLPGYVTAHYMACCSQSDHFGNGNKYPFNPSLPLNTDTSNFFANYNAPSIVPQWNSGRLAGGFFTPVNYVGAFAGTQSTTDNWMNGWCNFDCENTDYSLTSAPAASITALGNLTICPSGGSVTLQANAGSGFTYQWMMNSANISGATSQQYTATTGGTYQVTVTNATGCSTTSSSVVVNTFAAPSASITAGGPTTFCAGNNVTLTASGASSYSWSNGATTPSITANTSGNYLVTITDANGCQATSSAVNVVVNPLPNASVTANGPTTFCTGDSVVLTANSSSSYMWSDNSTTQSITVYNSGNYSVMVTDANGCQSASSTPITVSSSPSPQPTITIGGNTSLCQGQTVMLTSSTADSYLWSNGATTQSITVSASGNYTVTVTNANACSGTGASNPVAVTVNPNPTANFTTGGNIPTVNFTNTSTGATSYMWDFGDFSSSSLSSPSHTYGTNGNYTACLVAMSAAGCSDTTCMPVLINVGMSQPILVSDNYNLYPNPANSQLNIAANLTQDRDLQVVAFDVNGKLLINENRSLPAGNNVLTYDVSNWDNGIYFIRVMEGQNVQTMKVIINR